MKPFTNGHFFRAPNFSLQRSRDLYSEWIKSPKSSSPNEHIIVADFNGRIVGFVLVKQDVLASQFFGVNLGNIDLIGLTKEFRGKGVGYALMASAMNWFAQKGTAFVTVGAHLDNQNALALYSKVGLRPAASEVTFHKWL